MPLNIELLERNFELVKPNADEFVASLYNNLFTDYPASQSLFGHSDMLKQQRMFKGLLVMVVENLRNPEVLRTSLKGLGARYVKDGALPKHYPLVGNSLIKTLAQYTGSAWTPDLYEAWAHVYRAVAKLMLEGADYAMEEIALESVSPAAVTTPPRQAKGGLNVDLLEQSFELIKPKADEFTASFYCNLFTDYPAVKPLFAHTDMRVQQQMLKCTLVMVMTNLRRPEVLHKTLKWLGARHVKYGALLEQYPLVGNSLIKTLGEYAGAAWTPELESAWLDAYAVITKLMIDGAQYSSPDIQPDIPVHFSGVRSSATASVIPKGSRGAIAAVMVGGGSIVLIILLIILL